MICGINQERIELDNLVFQVRLDEERIKSQALQDSDRYVILIVKRPMVALRYQLPDGKVGDQRSRPYDSPLSQSLRSENCS
jgi:hypothetical protein